MCKMKVNPITNNTTFSSKIKYNETMQKGFELAKEAAKSPTKKNIDFAKTFSDNIRTILNDGRNDSIEILQKSKNQYNEGYICTQEANDLASKLDLKEHVTIETIKTKLEETMKIVDDLKQAYSAAVKRELETLENQIKKSN